MGQKSRFGETFNIVFIRYLIKLHINPLCRALMFDVYLILVRPPPTDLVQQIAILDTLELVSGATISLIDPKSAFSAPNLLAAQAK